MLGVQSRVKVGIEVPVIPMQIAVDEKSMTFAAIDKVKYADWLALNPCAFLTAGDGAISEYFKVDYTGDILVINATGENLVYGIYGISTNIEEY